MQKGFDVSCAQGNIDWTRVRNAGNGGFAMIRATISYPQHGKTGVDACWKQNIEGALAAGVPAGAFHYSYALTPADAEREAAHFLKIAAGYPLSYPVAFAFAQPEQVGGTNAAGQFRAGLPAVRQMQVITAFMNYIAEAGYYGVLYMAAGPMLRLIQLYPEQMEKMDKWVAQVNSSRPLVAGGIWQYSWTGRVLGVRDEARQGDACARVCLDYAYRDYPIILAAGGWNHLPGGQTATRVYTGSGEWGKAEPGKMVHKTHRRNREFEREAV